MIFISPEQLMPGDVIIREGGNITVNHTGFSKVENVWIIWPVEYPSTPFRYDPSCTMKVERKLCDT